MRKIIFLLALLLVPVVSADNYEIVGDSVQIDNSKVFLHIAPHTITTSGYQEITLVSKQYSGAIDVAFGFDKEEAMPKSLELYRNGEWESIASSFNKVNYNFEGYDTWYIAKNLVVASGVPYKTRLYLNIPIKIGGSNGKYYVAIKPSAETIHEAIANGHFFYIDPWWQSPTYVYRYNITNTSILASNVPYSINDNTTVNGTPLWATYTSGCLGQQYVYSTGAGPSGSLAVANDTTQCAWENSSALTGNSLTILYPLAQALSLHFDDGTDANDSTSYNNDGTNNGADSLTGKIGTCLDFLASNSDYVDVPKIVNEISDAQTGTVTMWVNISDVTPSGNLVFFDFGDTNANEYCGMFTATPTGLLYAVCRTAGAVQWQLKTDSIPFTQNTWHHVALVHNGTGALVYIDAVLEPSTYPTSTNLSVWFNGISNLDTFSVGRENHDTGAGSYFNGTIDEFQVWNRSFTLDEIEQQYWNGIGNLTGLGVEEVNVGPTIVATPTNETTTTNTTVYIYATGTDPEASSLTYYLHWNESVKMVDSTTGNSGVAVRLSHTHNDIESEQNWTLNVSDGLVNTTLNRSITIDYTWVTLLNETDGALLDEDMNIKIFNFGTFEELNTTVGRNVTYKDIDNLTGIKIAVRASNTSSTNFTVPREIAKYYTAGTDFILYLPKTSVDTVGFYQFKIRDFTEDWSDANVIFKRDISGTLTAIHETFVDVENKAVVYLIKDIEYQITVNKSDDTRVFGFYKATHSSTTTVLEVELNMINITEWTDRAYLNKDINFTTWINGTNIFFAYDNVGVTSTLEWWIFNGSNRSQQLYYTSANGSATALFTYAPPDPNETHFSYFCANNSIFGEFCKWDTPRASFSAWASIIGPRMPTWSPTAVAMVILLVIAGIFGGIDSKTGTLVLAGASVFFWWIGWLDLGEYEQSITILGLVVFMAVLNKMTEGAQ